MANQDLPSPPNQRWEMIFFGGGEGVCVGGGGGWGFAVPFYSVQDCKSSLKKTLELNVWRQVDKTRH